MIPNSAFLAGLKPVPERSIRSIRLVAEQTNCCVNFIIQEKAYYTTLYQPV